MTLILSELTPAERYKANNADTNGYIAGENHRRRHLPPQYESADWYLREAWFGGYDRACAKLGRPTIHRIPTPAEKQRDVAAHPWKDTNLGLDARFNLWVASPVGRGIYAAFEKYTLAISGRGKTRYSADHIMHAIRAQSLAAPDGSDEIAGFNDNWVSRLARKALRDHPELQTCHVLTDGRKQPFFEMRALKA